MRTLSFPVEIDREILLAIGRSFAGRTRTNEGRIMVQQMDAEIGTGNVDESARYFNYLRTLADLTAMASIMVVQVIEFSKLCGQMFITK